VTEVVLRVLFCTTNQNSHSRVEVTTWGFMGTIATSRAESGFLSTYMIGQLELRCVVPLGVGRRGMKVEMGCDRNEWREKLRKKSKRGTWDGGRFCVLLDRASPIWLCYDGMCRSQNAGPSRKREL
jgi:hypothetical protein